MIRSLLLMVAVAACKGDPPRAEPSPPVAPAPVAASPVAPPPGTAEIVSPITDVRAYKLALAARFRRVDAVFDQDGTDCARIVTDLQTLANAGGHAATIAFATAHPEAIEALEHDDAWDDVVKTSAAHALRALAACKDHTGFMAAFANADQ